MSYRGTILALRFFITGAAVFAAGLGALLSGPGGEPGAHADTMVVSMSAFDDTLSPHGAWMDVSGRRVWRPNRDEVGVDFVPYASRGHWVYTDEGWSWESDWDWGWAPFHYGRWVSDPSYGWCWLPDTVWAPAWVDWRYSDGYVGWTPLAPAGFSVTVVVSRWTFVPTQHFVERDVWRHRVDEARVSQVHASTTVIHDRSRGGQWYAGPPVARVAAITHQQVPRVHVAAPRPGVIAQVRVNGGTATIVPVRTTSSPGHPAAAPGHPAAAPGHSAAAPGHPAGEPGHSAAAPGHPTGEPVRRPDPQPTPVPHPAAAHDHAAGPTTGRPLPNRAEAVPNRPEPVKRAVPAPTRREPSRDEPEPGRHEPERPAPRPHSPGDDDRQPRTR
jgi:uncharacterized protein DUF6600